MGHVSLIYNQGKQSKKIIKGQVSLIYNQGKLSKKIIHLTWTTAPAYREG